MALCHALAGAGQHYHDTSTSHCEMMSDLSIVNAIGVLSLERAQRSMGDQSSSSGILLVEQPRKQGDYQFRSAGDQ